MMSADGMRQAEAGLDEWTSGGSRNVENLGRALGASAGDIADDPLTLLPHLQLYVKRLPLEDFEAGDWTTLHTDLTSYVAEVMIRKHGARWQVHADQSSPRGYRYVLALVDSEGAERFIDPFEVAAQELRSRPIEVARMLANTEAQLRPRPKRGRG